MEEVKTIKIKKVSRPGFFGLDSYGRSVITVGCELSTTTGAFKTGLTKEEEKFYEEKLKLSPGDLDKHSKWWDKVFNIEYPIRLNATKVTELTLDNPINQIKYKVLLESSKVANTEIEKRKPNVLFYIDDVEAKAKAELEVYNYEFEAMGLMHKMSPEEKRSTLRLFGKKGLDTMTETMLNSQLVLEMKKDPKMFIETITDRDVQIKGIIAELLEKGLLKRKGNYYIHGDDTIASSTEECVDYFKDLKNQSVVLALKSKLNKLKK
jgi:hypothetical protein